MYGDVYSSYCQQIPQKIKANMELILHTDSCYSSVPWSSTIVQKWLKTQVSQPVALTDMFLYNDKHPHNSLFPVKRTLFYYWKYLLEHPC